MAPSSKDRLAELRPATAEYRNRTVQYLITSQSMSFALFQPTETAGGFPTLKKDLQAREDAARLAHRPCRRSEPTTCHRI